jgi:hypothetical protein
VTEASASTRATPRSPCPTAPCWRHRGYGVVGQSDILGIDLPHGEGSFMHTFANPGLGAGPLNLRLTLYLAAFTAPPAGTDVPETSDAAGPSVESVTAVGVPVTPSAVVGPYTFEFSLPVQPATSR